MGWSNITLQKSCGVLVTVLSFLALPGAAAEVLAMQHISTSQVGCDDSGLQPELNSLLATRPSAAEFALRRLRVRFYPLLSFVNGVLLVPRSPSHHFAALDILSRSAKNCSIVYNKTFFSCIAAS
jgi:hypothetical protein